MRKNKFIDIELGSTLKKFIMYFCVFTLVIGLVATIKNTEGTLAATYSCPSGWTLNESEELCSKSFATRNACETAITDLRLELNDNNYCEPQTSAGIYTFMAYISLDEYYSALRNCYYCDATSNASWAISTPSYPCASTWQKIDRIKEENQCIVVTVTYKLDGGILNGSSTSPQIKKYIYGTTITIPEPTDDEYDFQSWQSYIGTTIKGYNAGDKVELTNDLELNAVWKEKSSYETSFYLNDGDSKFVNTTLNPYSAKYESTYKLNNSEIAITPPTGKKLIGWSEDNLCESNILGLDKTIDSSYDGKSLYACYDEETSGGDNEPEYKYSVTFFKGTDATWVNEYGNNPTHNSRSIGYNTTYSLNGKEIDAIGPDGKKLCGWITNHGKGETLELTDSVDSTNNGDILWAKYCSDDSGDQGDSGNEPIIPPTPTSKKVTATFNPNGGTLNGISQLSCTIETGKSDCPITSLPTAEKDDHTFTGWGTSSSCTEGETTEIKLTADKEIHVYYACYVENDNSGDPGSDPVVPTPLLKKVTATFDPNGGKLNGKSSLSCNIYSKTSPSCSITPLPTAEKDNYTFTGWGTNSSCTEGAKDKLDLTESGKYYACYTTNQEIETNPSNGSALLYVAYIIGILSLGYTGYYYYKTNKLKK